MTAEEYRAAGLNVSLHVEQSFIDRAERDVTRAYIDPLKLKVEDDEITLHIGTLGVSPWDVGKDAVTLKPITGPTVATATPVKMNKGDVLVFASTYTVYTYTVDEYKSSKALSYVGSSVGVSYTATNDCFVVMVVTQNQQLAFEGKVCTVKRMSFDAMRKNVVANLAYLYMMQQKLAETRAGAKIKTTAQSMQPNAWDAIGQQANVCDVLIRNLCSETGRAYDQSKVDDICKMYFTTNYFYN